MARKKKEEPVIETTATIEPTVDTVVENTADTSSETTVESDKPVEIPDKPVESNKADKVEEPVKKQEKPKEEPFHTYSLNLNKCELKNAVFNFKLNNVKNYTYFKRGLTYFNYSNMLVQIETERTKVTEERSNLDVLPEKVDAYNSGESTDIVDTELAIIQQYNFYTARIHDLNDLHAKITGMKNQLKLTDEEIALFQIDNFMKLTASVLFNVNEECPLEGMSAVYDKLKIYSSVAYLGQFNPQTMEAFKALKNALQEVADKYNTVDSEYYKNSKLNVNSTMTMQVFQFCYKGCKRDTKTGNFTCGNKTEKQIRSEVIAQFTGKLQGSISNDK